jgi:hypothetical protein
LFVGLDPAGDSGLGDETAFCARRGLKMLTLRTFRGLNEEGHAVQLMLLLEELCLPRETPVVCIDRDGAIGARILGHLQSMTNKEPPPFEVVAVRASDRAVRQPQYYDRIRDELVANLRAWFRDGGAILEDAKLARELHAPEWRNDIRGRAKTTPKDVLRRMLGRSPDRFDALALSVWEPLSLQAVTDDERAAERQRSAVTEQAPFAVAEATIDPYAAGDQWNR